MWGSRDVVELLEAQVWSWGPEDPSLPLWRAGKEPGRWLPASSSDGKEKAAGQPGPGCSARVPRVRAAHAGGPPRPHLIWGSPDTKVPGGDFPTRAENRGDVARTQRKEQKQVSLSPGALPAQGREAPGVSTPPQGPCPSPGAQNG